MTMLLKYLNNYILKKINKNSKNNTYFFKKPGVCPAGWNRKNEKYIRNEFFYEG